MGLLHQRLEVGQGAELGVDRRVVADRVIAAQTALALESANGLDRHEPQDAHPHFLQPWQVRGHRRQRALWGELADIDLVNVGVAGPVDVGKVIHERLRT